MAKATSQPVIVAITALVTVMATLLGGYLLDLIQSKQPRLVYTTVDTSTFLGDKGNFAIYTVAISNAGTASIHDVYCLVRVPSAAIQYKIICDPTLSESAAEDGDTVRFRIGELNPSEKVSITVYATSNSPLPASPLVLARGDDITGVSESGVVLAASPAGSPILYLAVAVIVGALSMWVALVLAGRRRTPKADTSRAQGDTGPLVEALLGGQWRHIPFSGETIFDCGDGLMKGLSVSGLPAGFKYRAHRAYKDWTGWVTAGELTGEWIEAVQFRFDGHIQTHDIIGSALVDGRWSRPESATRRQIGTVKSGKPLEGIYLAILPTSLASELVLAADATTTNGPGGITDGLAGYWRFNEDGENTTRDLSGNGNDGRLSGRPLPAWHSSNLGGRSLSFNGGGFVDCGTDNRFRIAGPLSVSFWMYATSPASPLFQRILSNHDGKNGFEVYYGFEVSAQSLTFQTIAAHENDPFHSADLPLNKWSHVVFTFDGSVARMYLNGQPASPPKNIRTIRASSEPLTIGAMPGGKQPLNNAMLRGVALYARALSQAEVAKIHASG
jgi:hypothetical protein